MERFSEEDIKLKFITPAIEKKWDKMTQIHCEFTAGQVLVRGNVVKRGPKKRVDYLLSLRKNFPIAIIEAKDNTHSLGSGIQQAIGYAEMLDVPFVYSSNGTGFLEHDMLTGKERELQLEDFPTPNELWERVKKERSISVSEEKIINERYYSGIEHKTPRYYQRIAINRTVEAIARGQQRILITMATGTGKTFTAFQIVWRLLKSGLKKKVLYLADRNILVEQTIANDFKPLEKVLTKVKNKKLDSSYEVYFALYQQLVENADTDPLAILKQLKPDFFDLIIVDECHRGSADEKSKWRAILEYFHSATHIGMTATPKETKEISNIHYFGDPIYTYSLKQGIDDGFLAPYKVIRLDLNVDSQGYRPEMGKTDVEGNLVEDREYNVKDFDRNLIIYERTEAVAHKITEFLKKTDRFAKTIVFCVDIDHAERMRQALVNENSDLVAQYPRYIMRITGDNAEGKAQLDNFIDVAEKTPTIVTSSKLMTTGVDCKTCKLIVLENNIESMTEFKQIIGRGTRLYPSAGKEYFTIMDFRGVTRKFADKGFDGEPISIYEPRGENPDPVSPEDTPLPPDVPSDGGKTGRGPVRGDPPFPPETPRRKVKIRGVDVYLLAERVQYYNKDGKLITESLTSYTKKNILGKYATLDAFLQRWNKDAQKQAIIEELQEEGVLLDALREEAGNKDLDDFDLICHIAYDKPPLTKAERIKNVQKQGYLHKYSALAQRVLNALLEQYKNEGIKDLCSTQILTIDRFRKIASLPTIMREFGGKNAYMQAVKGLQDQLYSSSMYNN